MSSCEREAELKGITDRLIEPGPGSLSETLDQLRAMAVERLRNLRELISLPESVDHARAVLAEHFGTFKLEPVTENGKTTYRAHGKIDFFADTAMARTGGVGGPVCTVRATEFSPRWQHDHSDIRGLEPHTHDPFGSCLALGARIGLAEPAA